MELEHLQASMSKSVEDVPVGTIIPRTDDLITGRSCSKISVNGWNTFQRDFMLRLKAGSVSLNEGESIKDVWNNMAAEEKLCWGDGSYGGVGGRRVVLKCQVRAFISRVSGLTEETCCMLGDSPFSSLLGLKGDATNRNLIKDLLQAWNISNCSLSFHGRSYRLTQEEFSDIMGIQDGDEDIRVMKNMKPAEGICGAFLENKSKRSMVTLEAVGRVLSFSNDKLMVRVAYDLLALMTVVCPPESRGFTSSLLKVVVDCANGSKKCWARYAFNELVKSMQKFVNDVGFNQGQKKVEKVGRCTIFLQMFYLRKIATEAAIPKGIAPIIFFCPKMMTLYMSDYKGLECEKLVLQAAEESKDEYIGEAFDGYVEAMRESCDQQGFDERDPLKEIDELRLEVTDLRHEVAVLRENERKMKQEISDLVVSNGNFGPVVKALENKVEQILTLVVKGGKLHHGVDASGVVDLVLKEWQRGDNTPNKGNVDRNYETEVNSPSVKVSPVSQSVVMKKLPIHSPARVVANKLSPEKVKSPTLKVSPVPYSVGMKKVPVLSPPRVAAVKLSPGKDIHQYVEEKKDVDLGAGRAKIVIDVIGCTTMGCSPDIESGKRMPVSEPFQRVPWCLVNKMGLGEPHVWSGPFNVRHRKHLDEVAHKIICYAFDHRQLPNEPLFSIAGFFLYRSEIALGLSPRRELCDGIVNAWVCMLQKREVRLKASLRNWYFPVDFQRTSEGDVQNCRDMCARLRWTEVGGGGRLNAWKLNMVFVHVHVLDSRHFYLVVFFVEGKYLEVWDSLHGPKNPPNKYCKVLDKLWKSEEKRCKVSVELLATEDNELYKDIMYSAILWHRSTADEIDCLPRPHIVTVDQIVEESDPADAVRTEVTSARGSIGSQDWWIEEVWKPERSEVRGAHLISMDLSQDAPVRGDDDLVPALSIDIVTTPSKSKSPKRAGKKRKYKPKVAKCE